MKKKKKKKKKKKRRKRKRKRKKKKKKRKKKEEEEEARGRRRGRRRRRRRKRRRTRIFFFTILNVIPQDLNRIVTVWSVVFVKVADGVTKFVKNESYVLTASSHVKDLFSTNGAHH